MRETPQRDVRFGSQDYQEAAWSAWVSGAVGLWTLASLFLWFHTREGNLELLSFTFWDLLIPAVWILSLLGLITVVSIVSNAVSRLRNQALHLGYRRSCVLYTLALCGIAVLHLMQDSWIHQLTGGLWMLGCCGVWIQNRRLARRHQPTEVKLRGTSI